MEYKLIFVVDNQKFAIDLPIIDSVIHAVEVNIIPSESLLGVINFHGEIVPVLNLKKLLMDYSINKHHREKIFSWIDTLEPNHQFLICSKENIKIALWVDKAVNLNQIKNGDVNPFNHDLFYQIFKEKEDNIFVLDQNKIFELCHYETKGN